LQRQYDWPKMPLTIFEGPQLETWYVPEFPREMISGYKTRSVLDRYNIVNDTDLRLATKRQKKYLKSLTGTIHQIDIKKHIRSRS
jgi:hypothetical protein